MLCGLAGLAALGGGVALAATQTAQPEPSAAPKADVVSSELSGHLAALRDSPGAGVAAIGAASPEITARLDRGTEGIGAQYGLNVALAREVTYGVSHLWLVPGSAGLCLHDYETGTGVCGPIQDAIAGTVITDVGGNENGITGGGTVYGIAADGNAEVTVHDADGTTETVPVEHNVYIITHPGAVSVDVLDGSKKLQTVTVPG